MIRYLYLHELACLSCGRECGKIASYTSNPRALFVPQSKRCEECGGLPILNGEVTRRIAEPKPDFPKVRAGRPPLNRST